MSSHGNSLFLRESGAGGGCLQGLQDSLQQRALRTRLRLQTMTREHVRRFLRRNAFILLTVSAVIIGVSLAFALRPYQLSYRQIKYFSFPGELLMRMLQMLVLPLIVSSLVTGMASLDNKATGRMGMRAAVYYMVTTVIAVFIGILMVTIIHPGKGSKEGLHREGRIETVPTADAFMDLVRNMFPPNLVEACFKQFKTQYSTRVVTRTIVRTDNGSELGASMSPTSSVENETSILENVTRALGTLQEVISFEETVPVPGSANGINALGLVVFSVAFGLVIGGMKHKGRVLRDFFDSLNEAIMRLVGIIIWYAPVGILFLIAGKILEMEDMAVLGGQLGMYTLTVIVGLFLHAGGVLPLIYFLVTHRNPFPFIGGMLQALITAMGTSSSSATLPITFRCLEEGLGVDRRITRFVLPVGATVNMDGTALYEALAAIFIAQVNNYELNLGQITTISLSSRIPDSLPVCSITATAASVGAAGIPQAGLVTMVIVLTSVGLPTEDITLIIAVDWFLDRLRTMTNVLGDSIGAAVIEHLSQRELELQEAELTLPSLGKPYKSLMAQEKGASRGRGGNESVM
ncbi:excitatory amino acid transporter 4 isoform X3 [Mus musculus]|nr:excitatory amino acid transporter 4 isoform X3 [Mus musculus]XP_036011608.1 excitatory amino acid transporter 4 isoform X3 [Mus musculus]|eukprot:XP_006513485.2 PREDICTED: excitatory amino acid transporter 4 isoform X1 [Mus musculus]